MVFCLELQVTTLNKYIKQPVGEPNSLRGLSRGYLVNIYSGIKKIKGVIIMDRFDDFDIGPQIDEYAWTDYSDDLTDTYTWYDYETEHGEDS